MILILFLYVWPLVALLHAELCWETAIINKKHLMYSVVPLLNLIVLLVTIYRLFLAVWNDEGQFYVSNVIDDIHRSLTFLRK